MCHSLTLFTDSWFLFLPFHPATLMLTPASTFTPALPYRHRGLNLSGAPSPVWDCPHQHLQIRNIPELNYIPEWQTTHAIQGHAVRSANSKIPAVRWLCTGTEIPPSALCGCDMLEAPITPSLNMDGRPWSWTLQQTSFETWVGSFPGSQK